MDSQLFRLNQMSYQHHQHILNQQQHQRALLTNSRQHYSSRQQANAGQQQQQAAAAGAKTVSGGGGQTSASSGSDQDDQVQLSSLSTATNKTNLSGASSATSQAAILGSQHKSQQMMAKQQQQQQHRQQQQAAGHRQAALQAHTLAAANNKQQERSHHKMAQSSDQLTTSSDQTIDDLHHLAPHHHQANFASRHHHHHHQPPGRYEPASQSGGSSAGSQSGSRFLLGVLFTIAELLMFATVLLWLYWAYQHDDGLGWQSDRKQQFNTHAALMLLGFVFLSGQAMLIHRSFACCSRIYTKILHTILFVLATSAISLGLILAYTAQENVGANNKPIMHFYSLHAWCGLATVGLFVLQFVFGFVSFLILLCCDQATANYRAALLPIHKTFGLIIFSLAVATCLMGLLQTARSRLSAKLNKTDYHELAEPGIMINLIGCCLIALAILMPYIIRNLDIKRSFKSQLDRRLNKLTSLDHMRM